MQNWWRIGLNLARFVSKRHLIAYYLSNSASLYKIVSLSGEKKKKTGKEKRSGKDKQKREERKGVFPLIVIHRKLMGAFSACVSFTRGKYLFALTVFVCLEQSGRTAWTVSRGREAKDGTKVPGEFLQAAHQPRVARTGIIGGDGYNQHVLRVILQPDQKLGKIPTFC